MQHLGTATKNHAISHNNKYNSLENKEVEPVEPFHMKIYQINTYRKDLGWLHFEDEPKVQERQQVKDQQSFISIFVVYLTKQVAAMSTGPDMTTVFYERPYGRFKEIQSNPRIKKLHTTNQGSNFLKSTWDNIRTPIQFRRESWLQHLKRWFFPKNRPIHFQINGTSAIKWHLSSFSALKSTGHFLPQSNSPSPQSPVQVWKPILVVAIDHT